MNRTIGAILLIIGTSVGGGMLALPMATAGIGFIGSSLLLIAIWVVMTFSAYLILEVNLLLAPGANLISMAHATLGRLGAAIMWVSYLLLLYALLSAFTSGGADLVFNFFGLLHLHFSNWINAGVFLIIFGAIVLSGVHGVDFANRLLLTTKLVSFLLVVGFCLHLVRASEFTDFHPSLIAQAVLPVITSFGFAIIMPTLRVYLNSDVPRLRRVIFLGSLIPLLLYLLWNAVVQGIIPSQQLLAYAQGQHAVADLTNAVSALTQNSLIGKLFHLFTIICITTSFLAVSLCLVDFLRDGLKIKQSWHCFFWPALLAFVPPLVLTALAPGLFIKALSYAGVMCVILTVLLPGLMAYVARYRLQLKASYTVMGGKMGLKVQLLLAMGLLVFAFLYH